MTRYLHTSPSGELPPPPDIPTRIRTNPRVKAILWTLVAGMALLALIGLFVTHAL